MGFKEIDRMPSLITFIHEMAGGLILRFNGIEPVHQKSYVHGFSIERCVMYSMISDAISAPVAASIPLNPGE